MIELLVDTDVLVDHLRGERRLEARGRRFAVSVITRCELFAGRDDPNRLRRLLAPMLSIDVDTAIAELAGRVRCETGIATPDALIAATALERSLPLLTRNRRHFERVDDLVVVNPR
jgi:predicted nucleic acid-binding protein